MSWGESYFRTSVRGFLSPFPLGDLEMYWSSFSLYSVYYIFNLDLRLDCTFPSSSALKLLYFSFDWAFDYYCKAEGNWEEKSQTRDMCVHFQSDQSVLLRVGMWQFRNEHISCFLEMHQQSRLLSNSSFSLAGSRRNPFFFLSLPFPPLHCNILLGKQWRCFCLLNIALQGNKINLGRSVWQPLVITCVAMSK